MELNGLGIGCLVVLLIAGFVSIGLFYDPETETYSISNASSQTENIEGDAKGRFKKIKIEHNVSKNGVRGMNVIADFSVKKMKGSEGFCSVYFIYEDGTKVQGRTDTYTTNDGQLCLNTRITPAHRVSCYSDWALFVPYSEFVLPKGKHQLKCYCVIWESVGSSHRKVATSKYAEFSLVSEAENATEEDANKRGEFTDIRTEHNVMKDDVKGMNVIVDFYVKGMKGKEGLCVVYFYDEDGNEVKAYPNSGYGTESGQMAESERIAPRYDASQYDDFTLFVPYSEFDIPSGENDLKCHCVIFECVNSTYYQLFSSSYATFGLNRN